MLLEKYENEKKKKLSFQNTVNAQNKKGKKTNVDITTPIVSS